MRPESCALLDAERDFGELMSFSRRILFVAESLGIGGTETHLLALLPLLKSAGFEVAVFCFTEKGARAATLEAEGIDVFAAPTVARRKRSLRAPFHLAGGAATLFALIKGWRPSVAHFFLPGPYLVGAPVAILAGVPLKVMSRRSLSDYQQNWLGAAKLERALHNRMDAILGNSQAVVDELVKEGAPESKVHLIYNGVRITDACMSRVEARAMLGIAPDAFVATMVGNLFPYKGHLDLVASLAEIGDRLPRGWRVLCAGRDGGSGPDIARAIAEVKLGEHIHLLGERSDVPLILAASDIGILASTRNEGFSNAVLESMAAGLPMVVTDIGGNAEAVINGETGWVVPPHNPQPLAAAILKLALDSNLRDLMGGLARERASHRFSLAASVAAYCALYESMLAAKDGLRHRPSR